MTAYIFIYDCQSARQSNARRVSFTKELYGFTYSWKTKSGIKEKRKIGIIEECPGSKAVADSAIYVPREYKGVFDMLFENYTDILNLTIYEIITEVK